MRRYLSVILGWFCSLSMVFLLGTTLLYAAAKAEESPFFPEQELFKEANDLFLLWRAGDTGQWEPMYQEYAKLFAVSQGGYAGFTRTSPSTARSASRAGSAM